MSITACMVVIEAEKFSLWPTTHLTVKQARQRHVSRRTFGQADVVLQEDGHTDCGNKRNQALRVTHRAVSYPFDTPAVGAVAMLDDCATESAATSSQPVSMPIIISAAIINMKMRRSCQS